MYDDLVRELRESAEWAENSPDFVVPTIVLHTMRKAADAIEELTASVECYEATTDMALIEEDGGMVIRFVPKWIPVTEKPPKAYEEVLLLFPHNQAAGFCDRDGCWGVYSGDGFYTEVADNEPKPTHWARKLPEPPKEES